MIDDGTMDLVIGSGPAGIAAAHALLQHGRAVTMLDTGIEMEPGAAALRGEAGLLLDSGGSLDPIRDRLAAMGRTHSDSLPVKSIFGSDFPSRGVDGCAPIEGDESVDVLMSYARGGLSNIWGANVLPFSRAELASWPVPHAAMERAYRAVTKLIPLSAERDPAMEAHLPLYTDRTEPRHLSRQAKGMLAAWRKHHTAHAREGITVGASRIGVASRGCVKCGMCLDGCPRELIYSSAQTLDRMRQHPKFHYRPGVYARHYVDGPDRVRVTADVMGSGEQMHFTGGRLFAGCGALSSTRLVMASARRFNEPVRLHDSCYFLQPWLRARGTDHVEAEALQTLSQLCLRLDEATETPVHALIYTYNDFLRRRLHETLLRGWPRLAGVLLDRIVVVQGYLHSKQSPGLELRIAGPSNTRPAGAILVRAVPNPGTQAALWRARTTLRRLARQAGAIPVPGALVVGRPGKGYHFGGGFPMRQRPGDMETDTLGRPFGASRVHLIDASCFPAVPATNLTLTIMANAYRIASESREANA